MTPALTLFVIGMAFLDGMLVGLAIAAGHRRGASPNPFQGTNE